MPHNSTSHVTPRQILDTLSRHRRWWIVPAVAGFVIAAAYALVMPRHWQAKQGVMIRPSAAGLTDERLGKFSDLSEMKTLQETVLELARSQSVVSATLATVGPPPSWFGSPNGFPTQQDIVDFRENLVMNPPGGAEFGKTEVFYLGFVDKRAERAVRIVDVLRGELESRLKELRDQRAKSMIAELDKGVMQADSALQKNIDQLKQFEMTLGNRLIDLRSIESPLGGTSQLSQEAIAMQAELRQINDSRIRYEQLLVALTELADDPRQTTILPSAVISLQPALERVKQALIEAQLATAQLLSTRQPAHPFVVAAREREQQIRRQFQAELLIARQGVEFELAQTEARAEYLATKLDATRGAMTQLADQRAPYSKHLAAVENQTRLVEAARKRLADAQGTQAGAQSASLLARIDEVESGVRPVGPGRSTIALAGGLAGLLFGLGLTFVMFGPGENSFAATAESVPQAARKFEFTPTSTATPATREIVTPTVPVTFVADAYSSPVSR